MPPLERVLIANRGEIAVRIIRACFDEGIESVLAVSEADRGSLGAQLADRAVCIGPASAGGELPRRRPRWWPRPRLTGCDALHPGYGFVSERPELSAECAEAGIAFVGPSAEAMRRSGDKATARATAPRARHRRSARARTSSAPRTRRARWPSGSATRSCSRRPAAAAGAACAWSSAPRTSARRLGVSPRRGAAGVRRRPPLRRALRAPRPPRRGPGAGRRARRRDPPRPPRLHAPAPLPEADRGGARARAARTPLEREILGAATALIGSLDYHGAATCEFLVDPERGSVRLPRDQRAAAGRAPGLARWSPASTWCASSCGSPAARPLSVAPGRGRGARPRGRGADQRREPRARLRALARAARRAGRRRWAATSASTPPASRAGRSRPTTTRCSPR